MTLIRRCAPFLRLAAVSPLRCLRVACWTVLAIRRLRRDLDAIGLEATSRLAHAPAAPVQQRRIVAALLRVAGATCLVRAAVLQRWDADHGRPRALVIGVAPSAGGYLAHAWLEGERAGGYVELYRRAVP